MTNQVVGIASSQRLSFRYAHTPGDTSPHPDLPPLAIAYQPTQLST